MSHAPEIPTHIEVRGAHVHNLKNIDVDIPLNQLVGIAGVSGSGKSSLALGVLYAEGSRRYLEALSTYTRRRMTQAARAQVDDIRYVPATLALHQRPAVPGVRSTFGTMSELFNSLRLLFSRCGSHTCPQCGTRVAPSLAVAAEQPLVCPACGTKFYGPSAESFAFNSEGACPTCSGTGIVREVDESTLVPDESISIDDGAVKPWGSLMWDLMKQVCRAMGVRTDIPFNQLSAAERDIVFHGPAEKRHILYKPKKGDQLAELDFTYYNAVYSVENALAKVKDEKGLKRVARFLKEGVCPTCHGSRLSTKALSTRVDGHTLAQVCEMPLDELSAWVGNVASTLPEHMHPMAHAICDSFLGGALRLEELGLDYLSLDRAGSTLSTGERQRVQLARSVRNQTTGVLYVLDEPSIGLHPANIEGLFDVMRALIHGGNSVVMVDHDTQVLAHADWLIEMGPRAGADGGRVIAQGTRPEIEANPASLIGPFLPVEQRATNEDDTSTSELFAHGTIHMETSKIHTVQPLSIDIPREKLVVITGVSGSGKTTLVLESLIPALTAAAQLRTLPAHVRSIDAEGIARAELIDATPIGINIRSTVATYAGIHNELRRAFARTDAAREKGYKAGDFSYNTGRLRCPTCDGTGQISLDVQFLPDIDVMCPSCRGTRYTPEAQNILRQGADGSEISLPQLMSMSVDEARDATCGLKRVQARLTTLHDLGLGYLTLGEATPALSGGEAQRLKLASEMGRAQHDTVFVFDEPTIGLHPLDVRVLLQVFDHLAQAGATVVVIEHDLDVIAHADFIIDMGPGGGSHGGRIVAAGTPHHIATTPESLTGRYLMA